MVVYSMKDGVCGKVHYNHGHARQSVARNLGLDPITHLDDIKKFQLYELETPYKPKNL